MGNQRQGKKLIISNFWYFQISQKVMNGIPWNLSESYVPAHWEDVGSMAGSDLMVSGIQEVGLDDHNNPSDFIMYIFKKLTIIGKFFHILF